MERRLEQQRGRKLLRDLGKSGIQSRETFRQRSGARVRRAGRSRLWCGHSMGIFHREGSTRAAVWLGESGCRLKDKLGAELEGSWTEKMPRHSRRVTGGWSSTGFVASEGGYGGWGWEG